LHARKTCFKRDFLSPIQQISVNVMKISAKINTMQITTFHFLLVQWPKQA